MCGIAEKATFHIILVDIKWYELHHCSLIATSSQLWLIDTIPTKTEKLYEFDEQQRKGKKNLHRFYLQQV